MRNQSASCPDHAATRTGTTATSVFTNRQKTTNSARKLRPTRYSMAFTM
jgi:hypothetical protein